MRSNGLHARPPGQECPVAHPTRRGGDRVEDGAGGQGGEPGEQLLRAGTGQDAQTR